MGRVGAVGAVVASLAAAASAAHVYVAPGCTDDPHYNDVWMCANWVGYACADGDVYVNTHERISLLMTSCPQGITLPDSPRSRTLTITDGANTTVRGEL